MPGISNLNASCLLIATNIAGELFKRQPPSQQLPPHFRELSGRAIRLLKEGYSSFEVKALMEGALLHTE